MVKPPKSAISRQSRYRDPARELGIGDQAFGIRASDLDDIAESVLAHPVRAMRK